VLPIPALLEDEDTLSVRHVCGGVSCPQGDEVVWPLPGVASTCGAHCYSQRP
jgi:hypothetical protein